MVLLEHGQDLEAAPAAVRCAASRVVGDVLQLAEHEARHDQRAAQEAGGDDVGDAAVDDGAGVDVGRRRRLARARASSASRRATAGCPAPRAASQQVVPLGDVRPIMPSAEHDRDADGQQPADGAGQVGERQAEQEAHEQAEEQAGDGGHELAGRHVA